MRKNRKRKNANHLGIKAEACTGEAPKACRNYLVYILLSSPTTPEKDKYAKATEDPGETADHIGYNINHKADYTLMWGNVSYRGDKDSIAENHLNRNFKTYQPEQNWVTEITVFKVNEKKLFISPMMDLCNREIVPFTLGERPALKPILEMVKKALEWS